MSFDKNKSKIALTIPQFTVKKTPWELGEGKYTEPYIASMTVDATKQKTPAIAFNLMPFCKVRPGCSVKMVGDGHLIYGPANPGEFVATSVLIMESDRDIQNVGQIIEDFVKSKAVELGMAAIIAANVGSAAILAVLKELTQFVAGMLKNNKDDELFRLEGTFLRDGPVPYHINREYRYSNDFVEVVLGIIPLDVANGQGSPITRIEL